LTNEPILLDSLTEKRAMVVLRQAVLDKNDALIDGISRKYNIGPLLCEYINEKNVESVKRLIALNRVNWHSSFFGGDTFIDLAMRTKNVEIINMVLNASGFSPPQPYPNLARLLDTTSNF
jgi:hypothetical protein